MDNIKNEVNQLQKQVDSRQKQQLDNLLSKLEKDLPTYFLNEMKNEFNLERGYFFLNSDLLFEDLGIEHNYLKQKDLKKVVKQFKNICKKQGVKCKSVRLYAHVFRFEAEVYYIKNSRGFFIQK
ncbi:hypothetical protein JZO86_17310 [Enterococcus ureasiticus]|uniref:hypothetical protein n=1 Tax=Enterococcus ureasiticus TaxID=903984 RepID=UPI001A8D3999|nr:hypothetical protein [Enterococcus ureasiticus]MBO0475424.1 hypothetical protein [Enterococcus ureasiticus]